LGLLVVRSGSVVPAMLFHLVYNTLLIGPGALLPEVFGPAGEWHFGPVLQGAVFFACTLLAVAGLAAVWRYGRPLGEAASGAAPRAERHRGAPRPASARRAHLGGLSDALRARHGRADRPRPRRGAALVSGRAWADGGAARRGRPLRPARGGGRA